MVARLFLFAALTLAAAGCTSFNPATLTPEQINALARDKNINVMCNTVTALTWKTTFVYLIVDKDLLTNGTLNTTADCQIFLGEYLKLEDTVIVVPQSPALKKGNK